MTSVPPSEEELTGGEVKVSVKYGIITIFSNTLDLCTLLKDAGFTCPLAPKTYEGSLTQMIPNAIPAVSHLVYRIPHSV